MSEQPKVADADLAYFNGSIKKITTDSSVMISSSAYLNNGTLRQLVAQEMLRRNGADLPNTAYIPEVAQILMSLEDFPKIVQLFEEEKQRLPEFKKWLDDRDLFDIKAEDVAHCAPGTLGAKMHDFIVNSGFQLDIFYQGMVVDSDLSFYFKQSALTHDVEHMVTGFGPNHGGEIALVTANLHARGKYFKPELAMFFNRIQTYLRAKTMMKDGLHYPASAVMCYDAEFLGAQQGRNWKYPLMCVNWKHHLDKPIPQVREELGIYPIIPDGLWDKTDLLCDEGVMAGEKNIPYSAAAE
jgi:ubiquinone biosynthesis protein COQ4